MPREVPKSNDVIRLFDRVRAANPKLPDVPVIVADEIQRQIDEVPAPEHMSYPAEWYGVVAPPFRGFFVESTAMHLFGDTSIVAQRGMFIDDMSEIVRAKGPVKGQYLPEGWRFCLFAVAHMYTMQTGLQSYRDVTALIHLDGEGRILDDMDHVNILVTQRPGLTSEEAHLQAAATAGALPTTLKAISAMHLRCPVDEVTPSATAQKRAAKHGGIPKLHTYYVLRVKPTEPKSAEDFKVVGMPERIGASTHKVRGHFRYYHPDRPMFGRVSGSVWVPDHERGSDDYGGIKKDYEV